MPELANRVRHYTAHTPTLYPTTTTAAGTDARLRRVVYRCEGPVWACDPGRDQDVDKWLKAHERYDYVDTTTTQRLKLIVCLCSFRHGVTHFGPALSRVTRIGPRISPGEQRVPAKSARRWSSQPEPCWRYGWCVPNVVDHRRSIVGRSEISDD